MLMTSDIVPAKLRRFVGNRPPLADQRHRAFQMAFTLITEVLAGADTPFGRMAHNGLTLCDETESFLYDGEYGHLSEPYARGSRPMLEAYLESVIDDSMSDGEKAIALCQSLHDLPGIYGTSPAFLYGESDEEVLLKGGGHCSCKARLLCSLCQIAGIQSRPVFFWVWFEMENDPDARVLLGGHSVNEILIDGEWGFFDPECHVYCQTEDGRFPSVREIRRSPELFSGMSADLKSKMNPRVPSSFPAADIAAKGDFFDYYAFRYFSPIVPTSISRHEVTDTNATIRWNWATDAFREQQTKDHKAYKRVLFDLARRGDLSEEIYQLRLDAFRERFGLTGDHLPSLLTPTLRPQTMRQAVAVGR